VKRPWIIYSEHRTAQLASCAMLAVDSQRHVTCRPSYTGSRLAIVSNSSSPHCASKLINYTNLPIMDNNIDHNVLCCWMNAPHVKRILGSMHRYTWVAIAFLWLHQLCTGCYSTVMSITDHISHVIWQLHCISPAFRRPEYETFITRLHCILKEWFTTCRCRSANTTYM